METFLHIDMKISKTIRYTGMQLGQYLKQGRLHFGFGFQHSTLCLKKRPTFDLLWSLHTRFDCNNFGKNVWEKV